MDKQYWKDLISYALIRAAVWPFSLIPLQWLRACGKGFGNLAFYCLREYRKRTLSNLSLANDLAIAEKDVCKIARESFQNLAINCLEYAKFSRLRDLSTFIRCENPEVADALYQQKQGIIFFCGHQSNWEVLFLDGTRRMEGIAIGKPIKNKRLYQWILSIREKYGGTIIAPKNGVKEGLRALRKGIFLGIVGDQGMPDSGYSFPFLGRRAWTTTAPALLSYKTSCPIIFAATKRTPYGYAIRYGDPIWPNLSQPIDTEVVRIMNQVLTQLQESILASPSEWLWQHNRWKQQTPKILYKRFRRDCVYLVMPTEKAAFYAVFPHLSTLRSIYHNAFVFIAAPAWSQGEKWIESDAIFFYEKVEETLRKDYRYKLVFDFLGYPPLAKFYERLSAFEVLTLDGLRAIAKEPVNDLSDLFLQALCRKR